MPNVLYLLYIHVTLLKQAVDISIECNIEGRNDLIEFQTNT